MKRPAKRARQPVGKATVAPKPERLASLDAFRGLVILTMIFVNYIQEMPGAPKWLLHVAYGVDGYTLTDLVFPGFLFIVGVAIPLSLVKRLAGGLTPALFGRIFIRFAALLLLGLVVDINNNHYSSELALLPRNWYYLLTYLSIIGLWNIYPRQGTPARLKLYRALQIASGLLLVVLLALYRAKGEDGAAVWLRHSWWGILGMIGWTYLTCSLCYLACRGNSTALMGVMGFMVALFIGGQKGMLDWLGPFGEHVWVGGLMGSHSAIVMAGVLVGILFTDKAAGVRERVKFMAVFGPLLYLAGQLLRPLHGVNKIGGTESYALVSAGLCCLAFLAFYLLMDVARARRWAAFLQPIGVNPLLAYILPGLLFCIIGITGAWGLFVPFMSEGGGPGLANAGALTLLVLGITWGLTKLKVMLRL